MLKTIQIFSFFLFQYIFLFSINVRLIRIDAQDLPPKFLETQNHQQEISNSKLDEYLDEDDLQQILDVNFENNHQFQNLSQELLELAQQESESNSQNFNENSFNDECPSIFC
jgi:hypothetical protein